MHNLSEQGYYELDLGLCCNCGKSSPGNLFSKHGHLDIMSYTDFDFASFKMDKKSTFGYLTFIEGNLMS